MWSLLRLAGRRLVQQGVFRAEPLACSSRLIHLQHQAASFHSSGHNAVHRSSSRSVTRDPLERRAGRARRESLGGDRRSKDGSRDAVPAGGRERSRFLGGKEQRRGGGNATKGSWDFNAFERKAEGHGRRESFDGELRSGRGSFAGERRSRDGGRDYGRERAQERGGREQGRGGNSGGGVSRNDRWVDKPQPQGGRDSYAGRRDSYAGGRDGYAGGRDGYAGGKHSYASGKDSYASGRDRYAGSRAAAAASSPGFSRNEEKYSSSSWGKQQEDEEYDAGRSYRYGKRAGKESYGSGDWEREGRGDGRRRGRDGDWEEEPKPPTIRDQWVGEYVYGISPVLAALKAGRREITALYVQEGMHLANKKNKWGVQAVRELAEQSGINVIEASKQDLNLITDSRPHQGYVLDCAALEFETMNSLPEPPPSGREANGAVPLWLCLDEVMDPQNFGAALRSAYFLGVSGVLTCHRNSAPLSGVVSKASSGAMELMAVHACKSMPQTLADAKRKGWQLLGAEFEKRAVPCASFKLERPTILLVGNEGYGVRPLLRRLCDATLRIEGNGIGGGVERAGAELVDSLNVSVATGILLHQLINSAPKP